MHLRPEIVSANDLRAPLALEGPTRTVRGVLRHSFVSILSDNEVTIETIADLVGPKTTVVTQKVCR